MISFLEGISRVLGRDRDADVVLEELDASPLAQQRLRAILAEPALRAESGSSRVDGPHATEFLEILAETIESRDVCMRGHARRVAFLADLLAGSLCLARQEREHLRIAAFLHDIGKVGAPSEVLAGKLLPEPERLAAIQDHPEIGERLLRPLGLGTPIAQIVRHHHERFDGAGYPDALVGMDIPLASRVIGIADAFDAMTCERPYRAARSREGALAELRSEAGAQFDPNLVELFAALIESGAAAPLEEAGGLELSQADLLGGFELARRGAA
jgi:putative nucleotidyltransferase with HDIG domain